MSLKQLLRKAAKGATQRIRCCWRPSFAEVDQPSKTGQESGVVTVLVQAESEELVVRDVQDVHLADEQKEINTAEASSTCNAADVLIAMAWQQSAELDRVMGAQQEEAEAAWSDAAARQDTTSEVRGDTLSAPKLKQHRHGAYTVQAGMDCEALMDALCAEDAAVMVATKAPTHEELAARFKSDAGMASFFDAPPPPQKQAGLGRHAAAGWKQLGDDEGLAEELFVAAYSVPIPANMTLEQVEWAERMAALIEAEAGGAL